MNKIKTKLNKIVDIIVPYIVPIILFLSIVIVIAVNFYMSIIKPEKCIANYNNDDCYIVTVIVGSGRSRTHYNGSIKKDDYDKWIDGDGGVIWITTARNKDKGYRINSSTITTIKIYSKDDIIPINFY